MLQNELTNNTNSSAIQNVKPQTDKQADIVKRLEELNKWQDEQKKLLEERQTMQRQLLGMEQQTMYQMLGLHSESEINVLEGVIMGMREERNPENKENQMSHDGYLEEYEEENSEVSFETSQLDEDADNDDDERKDDPSTYKTVTSGYGTEDCLEIKQQKPKQPFLKRGEGLKQRFKIDPDELRLNNLPKYKYANAHPKLSLKPPGKLNKPKNLKSKKSVLPKSPPRSKMPPPPLANLDAQEQRFQNLLITSKNTCSSTPDTKSSFVSQNQTPSGYSNSSSASNKVKFLETKSQVKQKIVEIPPNEGPKQIKTPTVAVAWSKILDSQQITPLEVPRNRLKSLPQSEESIFELLEQKAINGSFDMNSSCIKEFMQRKIKEKFNDTEDIIPVQEQLKTRRLEPLVPTNIQAESSSLVEESQFTEEIEEEESEDTTHKTIETTNSSYAAQTHQVRVRFSNSNETHEYDDDVDSTINESTRMSADGNGQGDTSNNEFFDQFKKALFAALQTKADQHIASDSLVNSTSDTTLTPKDSLSNNNNSINSYIPKDLQEKTDMIKMRLAELEKEINNFKENNIILMKAKQDHELEKSLHAQEHLEAMERLKDERIQMEIYLHDERIKLEDEKRQFEQNIKMKSQGSLAKERKENERLREEVAKLQMELKTKDANHTSAQGRLRTQIRNLERDQKKFYEQIETLQKENKRLEGENLKISREQNNKLLQEINRNIAKLAPKQIQNMLTTMPEEGPPTMARTVSNCIVAAATANKKYHRSPTKKLEKTHKSKSNNFPSAKNVPSPSSVKADTSPESSFIKGNNNPLKQKYILHNEEADDDDDDDNILKEFQKTPNKKNNLSQLPQENKLTKLSPKHQQQHSNLAPPPPSSPRLNNNTNNMKREIVNGDGSKDIWYPNGNLKKISADGMIIRMLYYNKDIKETNINEGTVKYYYAETNTWHTTYLDGLEILEFPNGQVEHRHKDGIVEVHYPNNSVKIMNPKDEHKQEEWRFADGTHLVQMRNGDKVLSLPNGQKELHNKLHKRREYPDGTVKIVYPDGSTETRYSNGRVRLKDKDGKLVMDTDLAK